MAVAHETFNEQPFAVLRCHNFDSVSRISAIIEDKL